MENKILSSVHGSSFIKVPINGSTQAGIYKVSANVIGSNIVVDGTFAGGGINWTTTQNPPSTVDFSSGYAEIDCPNDDYANFRQTLASVLTGDRVVVKFDATKIDGVLGVFLSGSSDRELITESDTYTIKLTAEIDSPALAFERISGNTHYQVDNITAQVVSETQSHYIIVEPSCVDDICLKWLAKDGFYKFGTFSKYVTKSESTKDGLKVPTYFTALSDTLSNERITTKELQKSLRLGKQQVSNLALDYYSDLGSSPKVYLDTTGLGDWIEVFVNWNPSYGTKKKYRTIFIDVNLPKSYNQIL
jgi:hypothetical protein